VRQGESVSDVELLREAIDARVSDVYTMLPAVVVSYDDAKQTCVARVAVQTPIRDEEGETTYEPFPDLPNVPVLFPRCAAFELRYKLAAGDGLMLVFAGLSPAEWRSGGKVPCSPGDTRRAPPAYPVALPGWFPNASASAELGAGELGAIGPPAAPGEGLSRLTFEEDKATFGPVGLANGAQPVALAHWVSGAIANLTFAVQQALAAIGEGGAASGSAAGVAFDAAIDPSASTDEALGATNLDARRDL
jgi:hypothetical protein